MNDLKRMQKKPQWCHLRENFETLKAFYVICRDFHVYIIEIINLSANTMIKVQQSRCLRCKVCRKIEVRRNINICFKNEFSTLWWCCI